MKCRVSQGVSPQALLEEFESFDLLKLHFPKTDGTVRSGQAYLEFASAAARRQAHTKNETYIHDCQLQLHYSSEHSLHEALLQTRFTSFDMASYKMQKQVFQARISGNLPSMPPTVSVVAQPQQQHQSKQQHRRGINQSQYYMVQMADQFPSANYQRQAQLQPPVAMMQPSHGPHGPPQQVVSNQQLQPNPALPQQAAAMMARPDMVRALPKLQGEARQQLAAAAQHAVRVIPRGLAVPPALHKAAMASSKNYRTSSLDQVTSADDEGITQGEKSCLQIPLNYEIPLEISTSLTEDQIAPVRNFLEFWHTRAPPPQLNKQKQCEVTIHVEVASEVQLPALDDLTKLKNLLESYSRAKPVPANVGL